MVHKRNLTIGYAILAAILYAISSPCSKLLMEEIPSTMMAGLLYFGAGAGMLILGVIQKLCQKGECKEAKLSRNEFPYVAAMVLLDIAAPIFLMTGLKYTTASNVSLLNSFEIVATSLIALILFKEMIGRRLWLALIFITCASIVLSVEDISAFTINSGSILVLCACICWGFENNCTRKISSKNPTDIVVIKGFGSGLGALAISFLLKEGLPSFPYLLAALLLGFVSYGLSIFFYLYAQRELGAARTSAYYAFAPFIGVLLSFLILREQFGPMFYIAFALMAAGTYFAASEVHNHRHRHDKVIHDHAHHHEDGHHDHVHEIFPKGKHSHAHEHDAEEHVHKHTLDIHHSHVHSDKV